MATLSLNLRKKPAKSTGFCPLQIAIRHGNKRRFYGIGIAIHPTEWNAKKGEIIARDSVGRARRARVMAMINAIERSIVELELNHLACSLELEDYLPAIEEILKGSRATHKHSFADRLLEFAAKKKDSTKWLYETTLNRMRAFDRRADSLSFEDIDRKWLTDFNDFMAKTSKSQNYRNIHLRNIRAVFNYAIDNELTTCYPFQRLKLRSEPTAKRSLSVQELRRLMYWPCDKRQRYYVSVFMLMFYLVGINMVDLYDLSEVRNGRITYRRSKTGRFFDLAVEPEAIKLIKRLKGKKKLIDIADSYTDHKNFLSHMNRQLKRIGRTVYDVRSGERKVVPEFPGLSSYWTRHTWATIAADLDVTDEVIAAALGHATPFAVTDIYIRRNMKKVDAAGRKVIDWVLYGRRDGEPDVVPGSPEFYGYATDAERDAVGLPGPDQLSSITG